MGETTPVRELIRLDEEVLKHLSQGQGATYVIRNRVAWPGEYFHSRNLATPQVLRSCRRLAKRRLVEETHETSYRVMKVWKITEAGRQYLRIVA